MLAKTEIKSKNNVILYCILYNMYTWAANGFDGIESRGECKQERYILKSSKTIIANNNYHFESARLAA